MGAAPAKTPDLPLQLSPGWRVDLIAEAPAIGAPSVVCCAPDGRIFMGEDPNDMGSPTDKPGDRIVCIHPDGKINVFATNLYAVFGLEYIDGKVYVHHTPKFSVFDDKDSVGVNRVDLIASDNPHPWAPTFNDHIPSGFHLGMDGYFYISTGDKGIYGAVGTDGRKLEMRGGIYRMRPDGSGLETYCTGTRNHLDIALNPEDEMFTYDNTDDGGGWWKRETHMVDGGYYGYPYDFKPRKPYTLWMMTDWNGQTGAPTGALCYDEDALPPEYRENLYQCDWSCRTVVRVPLKRTGSTYAAVCRVNFNKDGDPDFISPGKLETFRPVGICVTPDGKGFYVTDWGYNGWKTGQVVGRLLKFTYTNTTYAAPKPKWFVAAATGRKFKASTGELIHALSHPAKSVRMVAQRRLADRGPAAERKLAAVVKSSGAKPWARWSAIWTLDAIDGGKKERNVIIGVLNDKDATVQAQAARELGTRRAREAVEPLIAMLQSTNEALRFRAATALGRIGDRRAVMPLRVALAQTDLFARYAAFKALNRIGLADPKAWPEIVDGLDSVNPRIREGAFFAVRETYDPALITALTAFLAKDTIPTEPRTNVLNLLASLYQKYPAWNGDWWSTIPVNGAPPVKSVNWEGSPIVAAAMRDAAQDSSPVMRQIAFDWVRSSHDTNGALMLRSMFARETNTEIRASILRALSVLKDPNTRSLIESLLKDRQEPLAILAAAIDAATGIGPGAWNADLIRLAEKPVNDQILAELLQFFGKYRMAETAPLLGKELDNRNLALRQDAVSALTEIGGDAAIAQFMPGLDSKMNDLRRQSIDALGQLRARAALPKLIQLTKDKQFGTPAIEALTRMQDLAALDVYLDGMASKNAALRSECISVVTRIEDVALPKIEAKVVLTNNGLADETIAALRDIYRSNATAKKGPIFKIKFNSIPITNYQNFALANPGDSTRGDLIFHDASGVNCIRCHTIRGHGALIGPDLTGIGSKQTRAQIIESILYPSKVILDGYQQVHFVMKNDDDYSGIVRGETTDAVTVIDSMGVTNILQKSQIKSRKTSQISLMPDGLQTGLTMQEFSDLVSYLEDRGRGTPPPPKPAARPGPVADLSNHLPRNYNPRLGRPSLKPAASEKTPAPEKAPLDFLEPPEFPIPAPEKTEEPAHQMAVAPAPPLPPRPHRHRKLPPNFHPPPLPPGLSAPPSTAVSNQPPPP